MTHGELQQVDIGDLAVAEHMAPIEPALVQEAGIVRPEGVSGVGRRFDQAVGYLGGRIVVRVGRLSRSRSV